MVLTRNASREGLEKAARKLVASARFHDLSKELCADGVVSEAEADDLADQFRSCLKEEIALRTVREEAVRQVAARAAGPTPTAEGVRTTGTAGAPGSSGGTELRTVGGVTYRHETWDGYHRRRETEERVAEERRVANAAFWSQVETTVLPADLASRVARPPSGIAARAAYGNPETAAGGNDYPTRPAPPAPVRVQTPAVHPNVEALTQLGSFGSPDPQASLAANAAEGRAAQAPVGNPFGAIETKGSKTVDEWGRVVATGTRLYVLLKSQPSSGARPGLYRCSWQEFQRHCGVSLPSTGYYYKRVNELTEAQREWDAAHHRGSVPWIVRGPTPLHEDDTY